MNVEVLGSDYETDMLGVHYGYAHKFRAPKYARFRRPYARFRRRYAGVRRPSRFGSQYAPYLGDDLMGGVVLDFFKRVGTKIVKGASKVIKSPAGKVIGQASVGIAVSRLSPTDKATVAQMQQAAGLPPMPIPSQSKTPVYIPDTVTEKKGFNMQKNLPYIIIGGAVLVGVLVMVGTRR